MKGYCFPGWMIQIGCSRVCQWRTDPRPWPTVVCWSAVKYLSAYIDNVALWILSNYVQLNITTWGTETLWCRTQFMTDWVSCCLVGSSQRKFSPSCKGHPLASSLLGFVTKAYLLQISQTLSRCFSVMRQRGSSTDCSWLSVFSSWLLPWFYPGMAILMLRSQAY